MKNIYRIKKIFVLFVIVFIFIENVNATTTCSTVSDCTKIDPNPTLLCKNGSCYKESQCDNGLDDDGDGLIDNADIGCQGFDSSEHGKLLVANNTAGQNVIACDTYTMTEDADVLITLNDDSVAVIVKRVEDDVYVLLAKSEAKLDTFDTQCPASARNPINESDANSRTGITNGVWGNNDAIFYNRDGTLRNYYETYCGAYATSNCKTVPDNCWLDSTENDRIYSLRSGDVIYMATKSDKTLVANGRYPNTVSIYRNYKESNCPQSGTCAPMCRY